MSESSREFVELNRYLEAAKAQGALTGAPRNTRSIVRILTIRMRTMMSMTESERCVLKLTNVRTSFLRNAIKNCSMAIAIAVVDPDDDVNDNPEAPYELDIFTEIDTGLIIDTDYMNANPDKWLKALKENSPELAEMSAQQLHRSFAALWDEQRLRRTVPA